MRVLYLTALAAAGAVGAGNEGYFPEALLTDQHGKQHRFYSDLLKGQTVLINSFFTECQGVCPPMNQKVARVHKVFGEKIRILSISVDPKDTPAKLKEYAAQMRATGNWYFLTGPKENVDLVLSKLGQAAATREDHSTVLIAGNEPKQFWRKLMAMENPDVLVERVRDVVERK